MAITRSDVVYSGTLSVTESTITIPTNTTFILKGLWISNSNTTYKYAILKIDDKRFVPTASIPPNDTLIQDNLNIPVVAEKTIKLTGEVESDLDYYIWGINEVVS